MVAAVAGFLFVARLLAAPFSGKVQGQMRRHPALHWVWAVVGLAGLWVALDPGGNIQRTLLRRERWAETRERVERAGGWAAVRQNCARLAAEHPEGLELAWPDKGTNGLVYRRRPGWWNTHRSSDWESSHQFVLPGELEPLHPRGIRYVPSRFVTNGPPVELVDLTLFGGHRSRFGYGLRVVCEDSANYQPTRKDSQMPGGRSWKRFRQVAEGVFEFYY